MPLCFIHKSLYTYVLNTPYTFSHYTFILCTTEKLKFQTSYCNLFRKFGHIFFLYVDRDSEILTFLSCFSVSSKIDLKFRNISFIKIEIYKAPFFSTFTRFFDSRNFPFTLLQSKSIIMGWNHAFIRDIYYVFNVMKLIYYK